MEYTKIKEDYFHKLCHCVENGMTFSDFKALTNGGKSIHINRIIIQKLTQEQHDTLEAACFLITLPQVGLL